MKYKELAKDLVQFSADHDTYEHKDVCGDIHDDKVLEKEIEETAEILRTGDLAPIKEYLKGFVDEDKDGKEAAQDLLKRVEHCTNPVCNTRIEELKAAVNVVGMFCKEYTGNATEKLEGCFDCPFGEVCSTIGKQRLSDLMSAMSAALEDPERLKEAREWFH